MASSIDVAKKAGVSQATVSRVLNTPDRVKPRTREKVNSAMQELGYFPNQIARSLVTNTTRTIALISGPLRNGFFVETTDSIVHLAQSRGYQTIVHFQDEYRVPHLFELIRSQPVDGVLLSLIKLDDPVMEPLARLNMPCVFFNRRPRSGGHYVVLDNCEAVALITRHLLDLGHRKLAYLSGSTEFSTFYEREKGFVQTMQAYQAPIHVEWMWFIDTTAEAIEQAVLSLLSGTEPPTAIICATDTIALICMDILLAKGIRIPEDISLTGIDDITMASHHAIQLTTVGHRGGPMGHVAAECLFDLIARGDIASPSSYLQKTLAPELIVRKTTGPV